MALDLMDETADALREHYSFSSPSGAIEAGPFRYDRCQALRAAAAALLDAVGGDRSRWPDIVFGRSLVAVLAAGEASAGAGGVFRRVSQ